MACGLLIAATSTLSAQPYFVGIGDLGGSSSASSAKGISPDGLTVLGECYWPVLYYEVVQWTQEGGMFSLTPGRSSGTNGGINRDGGVVAGRFPGNGTVEAFRWTPSEGAVSLGDLDGGEYQSTTGGVSTRGDIIVGTGHPEYGVSEAFRWTSQDGLMALGDLPGGSFISGASSVSADGLVIVGGGASQEGFEAFRWTAETGMVGLGDLNGGIFKSYAKGVSADGSVIVGDAWDAEGQTSFRWTAETGMVALGEVHPDEGGKRCYGTSWDGNVIVGEAIVAGGLSGPFYWTPEGGARFLTDVLAEHGVTIPEGWHLDRAYAVSADGRTIVGSGSPPEGEAGGGWVAYLGPACRADYDESGSVNTADVIAYLGAWSQRSIFADWNYDGYIDTRDVIGFLGEWVAKPGCD